ncbi:hypothetical protein J4Q44_G00171070 [Coregonus suidteri]|uniref:Interferon a3-like n=1 Tax=Coregonus suidteri TaxID=861788 RepID=A0AAN8LF35_9TELE
MERRPRGCIKEAEMIMVQRPTLSIEEGEKLWTLRLAFQLASELFQQNLTLVKWNTIKLRELQHIARQNRTYSECVKNMSLHLNLPIGDMVKNYFKHLDDFLTLEADEQIVFISQTLKAIKKLYSSGKYESTAWDQKGVDRFMNDLHRQTSELDQCVKAMKTRLSKYVKRVNKKMSLHFKFLNNYLKREKHSASGWEDVRTVVLAHLRRLDTTLSSQ